METQGAWDGYWGWWGHAGSANRGWVKVDYLAAKCGENGNGWLSSAANIGFPTNPPNDCNGFADVNGTRIHVLESQGNDIFNNSDQFRYVYRLGAYSPLTFVGKINQVERSSDWSRGCLMIRKVTNGNPTGAGNANAAVCRLGSGMPIFQYRTGDGGTSTRTNPSSTKAKYKWAKLVLSGNTVTGYIADSDDNWNPNTTSGWEQIGTPVTINNLSTNYTWGLAASSNDAANAATVGFVEVIGGELSPARGASRRQRAKRWISPGSISRRTRSRHGCLPFLLHARLPQGGRLRLIALVLKAETIRAVLTALHLDFGGWEAGGRRSGRSIRTGGNGKAMDGKGL